MTASEARARLEQDGKSSREFGRCKPRRYRGPSGQLQQARDQGQCGSPQSPKLVHHPGEKAGISRGKVLITSSAVPTFYLPRHELESFPDWSGGQTSFAGVPTFSRSKEPPLISTLAIYEGPPAGLNARAQDRTALQEWSRRKPQPYEGPSGQVQQPRVQEQGRSSQSSKLVHPSAEKTNTYRGKVHTSSTVPSFLVPGHGLKFPTCLTEQDFAEDFMTITGKPIPSNLKRRCLQARENVQKITPGARLRYSIPSFHLSFPPERYELSVRERTPSTRRNN